MPYANHQRHELRFHRIEAQRCSQSYNSSSMLDPPPPPTPPYPPKCSASSLLSNPSICIPKLTHKAPNFHNSMAFLGDLPIGSKNRSASSILYDPLFHLDLPPQPTPFRELFSLSPSDTACQPTRGMVLFSVKWMR
ncbi:hypothetical protein Lalb_Chr12g0209171 [Lupinus albus]|uniref:Uncharacterized protein n=1 Tax=Lupinus albus TaxID=3870 RepID=A0A6A4PPA4_LUPAL|nr:hypothetical protein Lalb_Chr12g0209171 [Lupinus albus]